MGDLLQPVGGRIRGVSVIGISGKLREVKPWIAKNKLMDKSKN